MEALENFWAGEKIKQDHVSIPLKIISEQSKLLNNLTQGLLQGDILAYNNGGTAILTYCFTIIAPFIDQSRFTLFCIDQPLQKEFPLRFYADHMGFNCECEDLQSFNKCLKDILSSDETASIINNLIAKSKAITPIIA